MTTVTPVRLSHPPRSGPASALVTALSGFIPFAMSVTRTPGLNVALGTGGELTWESAFGHANLAAHRPMTTETVTRGASVSKLYTAIAVLQLVEQGIVGLHAPVKTYLPDLPIVNPRGDREITVYDLLTFRSGLATDTTDSELTLPVGLTRHVHHRLTAGTLQEYGHSMSLWAAKVGTQHHYSNLGIAILGLIVERTNPRALSFSDYVERAIMEPLGMRATAFPVAHAPELVPSHIWEQISTGYAGFGDLLVETPWLHSATYPSCGLLSIPADHLRLLLALAGGGEWGDVRLLAHDTVAMMRTPQVGIADPDVPANWFAGLGLILADLETPMFHFGHGGAQAWGWWNEARVYPHQDLAIAVFTNRFDMLQWHNPAKQTIAGLVAEFAARRQAALRENRALPPERPWPWKASYVLGALLVERIRGFLGVSIDTDDGVPDSAAACAHQTAESGGLALWDPEGFSAGARDLLSTGTSADQMSAFFDSSACGVSADELPIITLALGGDGSFPVPLRFWHH